MEDREEGTKRGCGWEKMGCEGMESRDEGLTGDRVSALVGAKERRAKREMGFCCSDEGDPPGIRANDIKP
jgi:hypothetical protein